MRWLVIALMLIPAALGQVIFEDPADDHEMGYAPMDNGGEPIDWMSAQQFGWFPYADVREIGIVEETDEDLVFRMRLGSWRTGSEPEPHRTMVVAMPFTFHGEPRQATFEYRLDRGDALFSIGFVEEHRFGEDVYRYIRNRVVVPAEMTDDGLVARFPKELLQDSQLVPARAGDVLEDLTVRAEGDHWFRASPCAMYEATRCWRARDVVPGSHSLKLERNPPGVGHLLLFSDSPYRASNGAATTYLFNLTVRNIGDVDDRVRIQTGGQPNDWTVHAPATMELPKGTTRHFPVAVSVPFKHQHGHQETMEVRVASTSRPSIEAVAEIGVVWHEVPQPGGHHPDLFLHSQGRFGWMNALSEDPDAAPDATIRWNTYSQSGQALEYGFRVPLSPRLLMGLDFERNGTVQAKVPIIVPHELEGTVKVQLYLSGQKTVTLAQTSRTEALSEGENLLEFAFPLQPGVDRFPPEERMNLNLQVSLSYESTRGFLTGLFEDGDEPMLSTDGALLRLPLQEYHDIIDKDLLANLGRLSLRAVGDVARLVNPERTVAMPFEVANSGTRSATVDWHVEGSHAEWARVFPVASDVRAGGNASVLVTVTPPAGTAEGEVAQLLLIGKDRRDPDVQVFARLIAQVTTSADIPDESVQAEQLAAKAKESAAKSSPGPLALAAVAVAVALAFRRR